MSSEGGLFGATAAGCSLAPVPPFGSVACVAGSNAFGSASNPGSISHGHCGSGHGQGCGAVVVTVPTCGGLSSRGSAATYSS